MSRLVRERFPDYEARIGRYYEGDHEFRGLCHDYGVCVEEHRKASESPDTRGNRHLREQLRELQVELELEIIELLNASQPNTH